MICMHIGLDDCRILLGLNLINVYIAEEEVQIEIAKGTKYRWQKYHYIIRTA